MKAGANLVSISNLAQTFCSDESRPSYDLSEKRCVSPTVTVVAQYRFPTSLVAVEGGISYCMTRGMLNKTAKSGGESYDIKLNHITLGIGGKLYPLKGAFVGAAISAGPCLNS